MQLSFSRGFSHGFLDGNNHKVLVRGDYAKKRGIPLGVVESVTSVGRPSSASAPVKPGDGLVFDGDESTGRAEQGGRVYEVISLDQKQNKPARTDSGARRAGPRRAPVRPRGDRPARARARPAGLEDRRSRADPPAAPIVRRAAESQGGARPRSRRRGGRAAADHGTDADRATGVGPIGRRRWRRPSREPADLDLFHDSARPAGRDDLSSFAARGDDRGPADGADEPAQPVAPRAGRPAG